jgi:phosphoribosyl-AMP cyclohydrolase
MSVTFAPDVIEETLAAIVFNEQGLVPAIAQDSASGDVLMMAWMNADAVRETMATGRVCYWSRSRRQLWRKGETSGQIQWLKSFSLDCDGDTLLLGVDQVGVACHTGRRSCFFKQVSIKGLVVNQPVIVSEDKLYGPR